MQGAHPEAVDVEARVHSQDDPDKLEAKRILNAKVSAYTLEAGVILHRCVRPCTVSQLGLLCLSDPAQPQPAVLNVMHYRCLQPEQLA